MAHSDTFIFLNSITWIFFLFLGVYFFLVTLFLPSLYKKVRLHTLVKGAYMWKFSAKLLNFFVVKLLILGTRLPVNSFELFLKKLFFYFSLSFFAVSIPYTAVYTQFLARLSVSYFKLFIKKS